MSFSAVLLAGGESRRMGRDKATIRFRDEPIWKHQLELLRRLEPQEIFVSAQIDPAWRPADIPFVGDIQPACGPLSGITAALSHSATDHLLVLAIDLPFMTVEYLRELAKRIRSGCGVVPMIGNRAEPLAAIYPCVSLDRMQVALAGGADFSLQSIVRNLIADGELLPIRVSEEDATFFRNLNAPGDLEAQDCA